jgi:NAD(P)-dependent dehydrogenase (short-subunit alcohol dehydrogenase family)
VNSVHPGIIETPAWGHLGALGGGDAGAAPDLDEMTAQTVPLGFKGVPDDIAHAVVYLASEDSRYVTGSELVVDGGQVLL